jgi:hypothetical protein
MWIIEAEVTTLTQSLSDAEVSLWIFVVGLTLDEVTELEKVTGKFGLLYPFYIRSCSVVCNLRR